MGSRLKSLLFGRSSSNTKGTPYDSAVARDPPVRGSYPVAGNGPNVLKKMQHARATTIGHGRDRGSSIQDIERPQTAPNGGRPASYGLSAEREEGTRSGFSTGTSPNVSNSTTAPSSNPMVESMRPLPTNTAPKRIVKSYQPKRPTTSAAASTTSSASHVRSESDESQKAFVDILDAHSKIRPARDASRHRIQASGVRNYGEDVADRNISEFGEHSKELPARNSRRLDLNSPDLSYLKSIYNPRKAALIVDDADSRAASALGHILGDASASDDMKTPHSIHTSGPTQARDAVAEPSDREASNGTKPKNDEQASKERGRAFPLVSAPISPEKRRSFNISKRTPSISRGRARTLKEPPPVPPPSEFPRFVPRTSTSNTLEVRQQRRHTMSSPTQHNIPTTTNQNTRPLTAKESEPKSTPRTFSLRSNRMTTEGAQRPPSLKGTVDLTNSVDTAVKTKTLPAVTHENLTRENREIVQESITREVHYHDVYHRILPVIDTEILPTKHYQKQDDGSLVEMAESDIPSHEPTWSISLTGPPNPRISEDRDSAEPPVVSLSRNSRRKSTPHLQSHASSTTLSPNAATYDDDSADPPVIPLARGEGQRRPSTSVSAKKSLEPILTSKKQYITEEGGYPRTEYVWYHPPVFEDMHGRTQPATIATGLPDLTPFYDNPRYSSDTDISDYEAPRAPARGEEDLLFRDSGYGSGMLPGLHEQSPMATFSPRTAATSSGINELRGRKGGSNPEMGPIKLGRVAERDSWNDSSSTEGEATKFLQRLRELRKSRAISKDHDKNTGMNDVHRGFDDLSLNN